MKVFAHGAQRHRCERRRFLQGDVCTSGRQVWRGRGCPQEYAVRELSASTALFCASQSSTSARCQPMDLPQWARCFGNCPRIVMPNSHHRGRRVRRAISRPLSKARASGSGSLTHLGKRTRCLICGPALVTEVQCAGNRASISLPLRRGFMGARMGERGAECSARIQGRNEPNTVR